MNPVRGIINSLVVDSPLPSNLTYLWGFGSILGLALVIQILTGVFLAMHYVADTELAFMSVEHIMRDTLNGWILRYAHANGAGMFFIVVYIHMARGLYYGSYRAPRVMLWSVGVFIFLLMMGRINHNEYELEYTKNLSEILLIGVNKGDKVKPVRSYLNADIDKKVVYEENKKKIGVYCWTNLRNGKRYVGSSVNLSRRLAMYYNLKQ